MLSACIVILTSLNFGNCVAFSNVALPLYKTSTNGTGLDVMLTAEEGSWFGTKAILPSPVNLIDQAECLGPVYNWSADSRNL